MIGTIALIDACVLHKAVVRDLFMRLSTANIFQPKWSAKILDEMKRSILSRDLLNVTPEKPERTIRFMNREAPEALVTGYEYLMPTVVLTNNEKDRHVLAAAIHCGADYVITDDKKLSNDSAFAEHSISTMHPDNFVLALLEEDESAVLAAIALQIKNLTSPPATPAQHLTNLAAQNLPKTAARLKAIPNLTGRLA